MDEVRSLLVGAVEFGIEGFDKSDPEYKRFKILRNKLVRKKILTVPEIKDLIFAIEIMEDWLRELDSPGDQDKLDSIRNYKKGLEHALKQRMKQNPKRRRRR